MQKSGEITLLGTQYPLIVNGLLSPRWLLVKIELLVAFNEMMKAQKSFQSMCNMNLVQRQTALLH